MNKLKRIREEKGVMQKTIADEAGLSSAFVHDLENGNRNAKPETWQRIAEVLDCDVNELFSDKE